MLRTAQESRTYRQPPQRKGSDKYRRPRSANLPARFGSDLRLLRLPVRRRRTRNDKTTAPAKPPNYPTYRTHDSRRFEIGAHPQYASRY